MRVIKRKTVVEFYTNHPDFKSHLESWYAEVKKADWQNPQELLADFPKASAIKDNRIVFRKGNDYRIIIQINYSKQIAYICFIGTHSEYENVDAETVWSY